MIQISGLLLSICSNFRFAGPTCFQKLVTVEPLRGVKFVYI